MICPEFRAAFWQGADKFDSIVFNPHKWLGAQFDCSIQFLRRPELQRNTLKIEPEYLKTTGEQVTNFSEWTVPLGRRFRALKLWFLIRAYGLEGLRGRLRDHVRWAGELCEALSQIKGVSIITPPILSLFSFRIEGDDDRQQRLVDAINDDGRVYLTQGSHQGMKIIRVQVGPFNTTRDHVMVVADVVRDLKDTL